MPAVAFTQAILLTKPSRLHYGDHVVLAAAVGGILDALAAASSSGLAAGNDDEGNVEATAMPSLETWINYEPTGHHNHWHVDWLEDFVCNPGYERPCPPYADCDVKQLGLIKDERAPIKSCSELVRPVRIGDRAFPAGSLDKIEGLIAAVLPPGQGLPIGDVENLDNLILWLDAHFFARQGQMRIY